MFEMIPSSISVSMLSVRSLRRQKQKDCLEPKSIFWFKPEIILTIYIQCYFVQFQDNYETPKNNYQKNSYQKSSSGSLVIATFDYNLKQ